ncbi:MAG: hypothetical protein AAFP19_16870 [Bacteroidota bacterium]
MIPLPYGGGNRYQLERSDYIKATLAFVVLIGCVVLFAFEVRYFNNTFEVRQLVLRSLPFGLLLGAYLGYQLSKSSSELQEKVTFVVMPLILCLVFAPTFASISNRLFANRAPKQESVQFVKAEAIRSSRFGTYEWTPTSRPDAYHLFIVRNNRLERIKVKDNIFAGAQKGDQVDLPVYRGLWGFDFVKE